MARSHEGSHPSHEMEPTASAREYEDFVHSRVWNDVAYELGEWIEDIVQGLSESEGTELYRFQGRKDAIEQMLKLPFVLFDIAKVKENKENFDERST